MSNKIENSLVMYWQQYLLLLKLVLKHLVYKESIILEPVSKPKYENWHHIKVHFEWYAAQDKLIDQSLPNDGAA